MGLKKQKCQRCKKIKPISQIGIIDFGWGNFKKSSWCKACHRWRDKEREIESKKFNKKCERIRKEVIAGKLKLTSDGKWIRPKRGELFKYIPLESRPILGRREEDRLPNGKLLKPACKGWYADDKGWRRRGIPDKYIQ